MSRKNKMEGYQINPAPQAKPELKTVEKKDYFTVYQGRMEKLLKHYPTTVISYFNKDDVIGILIHIATSFQPTSDDWDLSINTEVKVGDLLYDIGRLLSLSDDEMQSIIGMEKFEELSL